ncbi:MAG: ABC transporter ATP-binding protein [Spirochaetales bacterium]|nr:ABC transporter ATP-binding protein [Spirochaetales bacterium]
MTLNVESLRFAYKENTVLHDVSFSTGDAGITAVLGPNGSGKTTLLRCINRILKPQGGRVLLDDKPVDKLTGKEIAKSIAYVAQKTYSGNISVFDAILLGRIPHISANVSDNDMAVTNDVIERLDMVSLSLRMLNELSGGELQKVSIARALVQQTSLILLDEPTAALDLKNQIDILKLLGEITEKNQIKVLLSIHDLNTAFRYADQFIFLKNGKVVGFSDRWGITAGMIENVYNVSVDLRWFDDIPVITPAN